MSQTIAARFSLWRAPSTGSGQIWIRQQHSDRRHKRVPARYRTGRSSASGPGLAAKLGNGRLQNDDLLRGSHIAYIYAARFTRVDTTPQNHARNHISRSHPPRRVCREDVIHIVVDIDSVRPSVEHPCRPGDRCIGRAVPTDRDTNDEHDRSRPGPDQLLARWSPDHCRLPGDSRSRHEPDQRRHLPAFVTWLQPPDRDVGPRRRLPDR